MTDSKHQLASVSLSSQNAHISLPSSECSSSACLVYEFYFCAGISKSATSGRNDLIDVPKFALSSMLTLPAGRIIAHPRDNTEFIFIICRGWAARSLATSNGHRQILSFLLPGNLISATSPFESSPGHYVEAITDVTYRKFKQSDFKAALFESPALLEKLSMAWIDERTQADQLALNLGDRGAEKKIAWLILSLMKRLASHAMTDGDKIDFPLRQRHVASAIGLTHVHVGKVLGRFQRAGLIAISDRSLRIIDNDTLKKIAGWQ